MLDEKVYLVAPNDNEENFIINLQPNHQGEGTFNVNKRISKVAMIVKISKVVIIMKSRKANMTAKKARRSGLILHLSN